MSTSPQSDDLDTDLLETRFESSRSPHGQRRASPASDEVSEPEADTLPHQAGDADTAAPAESPNDGDEEPRSGTADALPEAPPDEPTTTPEEGALTSDDGGKPDAGPVAQVTESQDASGVAPHAEQTEEKAVESTYEPVTTEDTEEASTYIGLTVNTAEGEEPTVATIQFQQGMNGYAGAVDTYLYQARPDTSQASSTTLVVDSVDKGGQVQTLLRFDDIFGSTSGQIPHGATILSATLVVQTTSKGDGATLHRMLLPWSDSATWNSLADGIQADGSNRQALSVIV